MLLVLVWIPDHPKLFSLLSDKHFSYYETNSAFYKEIHIGRKSHVGSEQACLSFIWNIPSESQLMHPLLFLTFCFLHSFRVSRMYSQICQEKAVLFSVPLISQYLVTISFHIQRPVTLLETNQHPHLMTTLYTASDYEQPITEQYIYGEMFSERPSKSLNSYGKINTCKCSVTKVSGMRWKIKILSSIYCSWGKFYCNVFRL
jgi:hypothetical protein